MKRISVLLTVILLLSACAPRASTAPTPDVAAIVNATLTAIAPQPGGGLVPRDATPGAGDYFPPTETPTVIRDFIPQLGVISGTLSYPADRMPRVRIVAFDVTSMTFVAYTDTSLDQTTYEFEVPEGTYYIVAYLLPGDGFPGGYVAGYTQAVLCGLGDACADHTLVPVTVTSTTPMTNINPVDWSFDPSIYPAMPN